MQTTGSWKLGWIAALLMLTTMRGSALADPQFGMIGLAAGQTLRLNVVAYPANPCFATIGFLNANGVLPPNAALKQVSLGPGQADLVDLTAASVGMQAGQRREYRPIVTLLPVNDSASQCAASVEILDTATGFSQGVFPPDPVALDLSPQFGMVGIGLGQVLRLNLVAWPPDPCFATIGFLDVNGQVLQPGFKNVSLNPGQANFVEVTAGSLGIQLGQRIELQPVVTVTPGPNGSSACKASAEVFDVLTLRTSARSTGQQ